MGRLVKVSLHALERGEENWPGLAPDRDHLRYLIGVEVDDALAAGRYATRIPRWALRPGRHVAPKRNPDRTIRFAWTDDQERLYVLSKRNGHVSVVTAIRPRVDTLPS